MDAQTASLIFVVFFIAAFVKGLTGVGFATICLGFLAVFMDLKTAIPLVFIPSLLSSILVVMQAGDFCPVFKRFWWLFISALPGLLLGIYLLDNSQNSAIPKAILGITMCIYGIWALKNNALRLTTKQEEDLAVPIGFLSGLVNGITGSQIMPIMPYLLSLRISSKDFVQAINFAFAFNTVVMMIGLGTVGLFTSAALWVSAIGIIPVFAGIFFGGRLRQKVSEVRYRQLVLFFMIILGMVLLLRGVII